MRTDTADRPRFQPGWTIRVTLKRLVHQWRTILTMVVGVILAAIIGASIPLYTAAVGQVGLQQTLANAAPSVSHVAVRSGINGSDWPAVEQLDSDTRDVLSGQLGPWLQEIVRWEETLPLPPDRDGVVLPATRLRLGHYQGWQDRVVVEDGWLPSGPVTVDPTASVVDVEAAASLDLAQALGINTGDTLILRDSRESSTPIRVTISGLIKAADPDDPFWPEAGPPLEPAEPVGEWQVQGSLLVAKDAFEALVTGTIPETTSNLGWRTLLRHPAITLDGIPAVQQSLDDLDQELESVGLTYFSLETGLGPLLGDYAARAELLGAPFGLLIIQMGALTVYFMLMTAELIRHNERREISLMRSRGGESGQVWALRGLEALIICTAAVAIAPWVARAGLQQFGNLGPLRGLDIGILPLQLTPQVFAYSAGAGLTSWIVLMLALRPVLRASLVTAAGVWDRPESQAWWQRYYLDIGLLVLGAIAYWQLSAYGSLLVERIQGGLVIDPLLLLTPSLLMLAVGALVLRLFAPAMNLLAYLLARRDGLIGQLASWQISRRPVHHGRIALMLALAIGTGWFATSFNATVIRSRSDRAAYAAGTDLRVAEVDTATGEPRARPLAFYADLEGVNGASVAYRTRINASVRPGRSVPGELLGVDPATFGLATRWRDDLGVLLLPGAGGRLPSPVGRLLAPTPFRLGLWAVLPDATPAELANQLTMGIKVRDDDGLLMNIPLQPRFAEKELLSKVPAEPDLPYPVYGLTGWVYLEADLTQAKRQLTAPLHLLSIHWTYRAPPLSTYSYHELWLADLTLYDREGTPTSLDWLDSLVGWRYSDDGVSQSDGSIDTRRRDSLSDGPALGVGWTQEGRSSAMGLVLDGNVAGALPAIVSTSFLQTNGLTGQDPFQINLLNTQLIVRVVGVVDYYPSLFAAERPFLVTDLNLLIPALNAKPSSIFYPNEAWLRLGAPRAASQVIASLEENGGFAVRADWQVGEIERRMQADPLTVGLTGLFFIAFGVALVLSAIGLLAYSALTAQARRIEFSVLQSLGASPRRLLLSLAIEHGLVLCAGAAAGGLLGALLGRQILPFLSVTEKGKAIVPPFIVQTGVDLLLQYSLVMLAVFALLLLSSLWLLRRLPLARTLRLGEE